MYFWLYYLIRIYMKLFPCSGTWYDTMIIYVLFGTILLRFCTIISMETRITSTVLDISGGASKFGKVDYHNEWIAVTSCLWFLSVFCFLRRGWGWACNTQLRILARWAPYLISAYKWPYKWVAGVITFFNGVINLTYKWWPCQGDDIVSDKFRILIMGPESHSKVVSTHLWSLWNTPLNLYQ